MRTDRRHAPVDPAVGLTGRPPAQGWAVSGGDQLQQLFLAGGGRTSARAAPPRAIGRRSAPFEKRTHGFESFFHAGRLSFTDDELVPLLTLAAEVPTVVDVLLDRPAGRADPAGRPVAGLSGSFGAGDEALLDILFGRARSSGTLPFELPSSMAAVEAAREDVPNDTDAPLYPYAHGLSI